MPIGGEEVEVEGIDLAVGVEVSGGPEGAGGLLPVSGEDVEVEGVDFAVAGEIAGGPEGILLLLPVGGEDVQVDGVDLVIEVGVGEVGLDEDEVVVGGGDAAETGEMEVGVIDECEGGVRR